MAPAAHPGTPPVVTCAAASVGCVARMTAGTDIVESCGLDADDLRKAADAAQAGAQILDEIAVPRLLTGDLWTVNTMLAAAPVPTICGVLDMDRTWWGDPEADWTMRMARTKQDARMAFFDSYGRTAETDAGAWRRHVYEVRHLGALRLERHRLGNEAGVRDSYPLVAEELSALTSCR
ncbi:fructosamine kinase family protein [Streptomyces sp. JL7001]|uniref:fructosamine kinase family protein n=1 Tax=Streptomyces sp. JL7001 TaxID=3445784 RepID=UPI003F7A6C69